MPNRDSWRVVPAVRGVRYVLPPRELPWLKGLGAGILIVGLIFEGVFLGVTASLWWPGSGTGTALNPLTLVLPLVGLVGLVIPVGLGLLVGWGHAELLVTDRHAVGVDRCGPVRVRRRIALEDIQRLVVEVGGVEVNDRPVTEGAWGNMAGLTAERRRAVGQKKGTVLVIAYPRELVAALADELRERIGLAFGDEPDVITREHDGTLVSNGLPDQPAGSTALIERTAEGFSITLPALGFFKGSKGLGVFSILWLGFVAIFLTVATGIFTAGGSGSSAGTPPAIGLLPFLGVGLLFGGIGLAMFYAAVRSGRRRAVIDVVGEDLVITKQSTGAPKTMSWHRSEIDRVVVGKSGVEINDVPVMELQIWPTGGKKVGLFGEREDAELYWMAAEIRAALHGKSL